MPSPRRLLPAALAATLGAALLTHGGSAAPAPEATSSTAATATSAVTGTRASAATTATPATATRPATTTAVRSTTRALTRPLHGPAAVRALGDRLPAVARLNDRSPAELTALLTADPTMWVDTSGRIFVKEALPDAPAAARAATRAPARTSAAYPLAQTFALHSLPGSHRTIYLDFDGATVGTGLQWTSQGLPAGTYAGWDPSGDGASTFDDAERAVVQDVWARVAEDYAPFDVDVTTQDPGEAALTRTGISDLDYGTHVVVTADPTPWQALCGNRCGGIAWLGTFGGDEQASRYQLAWVFSGGTGDLGKGIAEAAAHEAGHTFGLTHDGTNAQGAGSYYPGHTPWAPIMGTGYDHGVSQWSKGDYADANNQQDDVATIAALAPLRADEAGADRATAAAPPTGTAYITGRGDVDYYALGRCTGDVTVSAAPAAVGADLDVVLRVVDAAGNPVATAAPAAAETTTVEPDPWHPGYGYYQPQVTGLDASVSATLPAGRYYAVVDGGGGEEGGAGDPVADYDDYGSLGAYTLSTSGCTTTAAAAPGAPVGLATTITAAGGLTASWSAPTSDGGAALLGYDVVLDGAAPVRVDAATTSRTWADVTSGSHAVAVTAVNETGAGPVATSTARRTVPGTPVLGGTYIATDEQAADPTVRYFYTSWLPADDDGGSPVTGFRVEVELRPGSWSYAGEMPAAPAGTIVLSYDFGLSLDPGSRPRAIRVVAVNEVGDSAPLVVTGQIPGPAPLLGSADLTITPDKLAHTLRVDWTVPYDGGSPILGARVGLLPADTDDPGGAAMTDVQDVGAGTHSVVFHDVAAGAHIVGLEPYNAYGARRSAQWVEMPQLLPPDWISTFAPVVVDARHGTATIGWTAPSTDPDLPILGYDVSVDGATAVRVTATTYALTGLALGSTHQVDVAAVNAAGAGLAYGPPAFRMATTPLPVSALRASVDRTVPDDLRVTASWTVGDNGGEDGAPAYRWRLRPVGGTADWRLSQSPAALLTAVAPGDYVLEVLATNVHGDSATTSTPVAVRAPSAPGVVGDLHVADLDTAAGTATVDWTAPADDGGSALYGYSVDARDLATGGSVGTGSTQETDYPLTGLVAGHTYRVEVTASNNAGGTTSAVTFTFDAAPGPATALAATPDRLARTLTTTWSAPSTGGTPKGYAVRIGSGAWTEVGDATTYTFTAVPSGAQSVQVRTQNDAGTAVATLSVTMPVPPVVPGAVRGLRIASDAAHGRATVSWTAPAADGGAPVTGYVVSVGTRAFTTTGTALTVPGLTPGTTYRVAVAARNVVGTGAGSAGSVLLTTRPAAPRIGAATPGRKGGSRTAVFAWSPPAVTGGSTLRGYEVSVLTLKKGRVLRTQAYAVPASRRSLEVRLAKKKGVTYAAVVRVRNDVGWSPASARSKAVTPR